MTADAQPIRDDLPDDAPASVMLLARNVEAPRLARHHVRSLATRLGDERAEDAVLLVSELVTNAVKYGGDGPIELVIAQPHNRVRVAVRDPGGPGPLPEMRAPGTAGGGHGLRLVDEIADRWGVEHGSTIVWFEFHLANG
jgi:anti-sigma regulatory factor (Ser/Thr protein kinase)